MYAADKRNIMPITDWELFLKEGKSEFDKIFKSKRSCRHESKEFNFISYLYRAEGSMVLLAKRHDSEQMFAVKALHKGNIQTNGKVRYVNDELKILKSLNFTFCTSLDYSFADDTFLYMAMPFVPCGELFHKLWEVRRFTEAQTKFFGAQILLALEYLHYMRLVHRDLKPENILIGTDGYLKLGDFGLCKVVKYRTYTLCGTIQYQAPEVILGNGYGRSVDWWALGILLYELSTGSPPHDGQYYERIIEKILSGQVEFPTHFPERLEDLIRKLHQVKSSKRLGCFKRGALDVKAHNWFRDMDFIDLVNKRYKAPYEPTPMNLKQFQPFHEERLFLSHSNSSPNLFKDF